MKTYGTLQIVATLILGFGLVTGHSQTYYYSGPVSGYTEVGLTPGSGAVGGFLASFGTLTETLQYDPMAQILEEVGSVTVNPSIGSFNIVGNAPPFSGPHGELTMLGSANLTVGNNGSFSFDRTIQLSFGGGDLLVPVSGSGVYAGQAFAASWNIDLHNIGTQIIAVSPTSLTINEQNVTGGYGEYVIPDIGGTGLCDGTSDGEYYYSWQLDNVVAMAVPEPNFLALLVLGLSALAFLRPRF